MSILMRLFIRAEKPTETVQKPLKPIMLQRLSYNIYSLKTKVWQLDKIEFMKMKTTEKSTSSNGIIKEN